MDSAPEIMGIIILVIYFARRMFWLSKTNFHNLITKNEEIANKSSEKSTDLVSWALLASGFGLLLFSLA